MEIECLKTLDAVLDLQYHPHHTEYHPCHYHTHHQHTTNYICYHLNFSLTDSVLDLWIRWWLIIMTMIELWNLHTYLCIVVNMKAMRKRKRMIRSMRMTIKRSRKTIISMREYC